MPGSTFEVETYTVLTNQSGTSSDGSWRTIVLSSTPSFHGNRHRASIYFVEPPPNALGGASFIAGTFSIGVLCRKADFGVWYDMLRNEKPVKFSFAYDGPEFDPNQPNRLLLQVQLHTGEQEPPGEGPEDIQAKIFTTEMLDIIRKSKK